LRQSDCLASDPDKNVQLPDGEHRLLQCASLASARFLRASHEAGFKMSFWKQMGDGPLRRCSLGETSRNRDRRLLREAEEAYAGD
jgi:hypothetical protein